MRLVPPDYLTEDDRYIKDVLSQHFLLKTRLTLLINRYRQHILTCIEAIWDGETDITDLRRSLEKTDINALRLGFPLAENTADWMELRDKLRVAQAQTIRDDE